ncbi:MAG TPA: glycosyltransferase family 2 protein [Solirubrobacteraceae bacterium]|nr:glycosyltransferase family 2 protein [Solirubrobacteraceae bacterium]
MSGIAPETISVVISTFERPQACERALLSALNQLDPPLEVLVCDNGSCDETQARFLEWERRESRVRYLRIASNTGTPAAPRNLGVTVARGEWVAFLDDDDEWLPQKLTLQRELMRAQDADVIATNALRSSGGVYFAGAPAIFEPRREQVLRANPIITSSSLVRRSLVHFPEQRWLGGVEDYAAWLNLADRGARFAILGEPLVRYEDTAAARLSRARIRGELAIALLAWKRALRWPPDASSGRAAARNTAGAAYIAAAGLLGAAREYVQRGRPQA